METFADQLATNVSRMYRVALRILGSPEAAQDVSQEACVKALRQADKFNGHSTLTTWLHRITVNCARDHLRKARQRERNQTEWDQNQGDFGNRIELNPAAQAERSDLYHRALAQVRELPEECRTAFVLTQLDGYTYDEASAIEDVPRGTVASRVCRARKILIDAMRPNIDGAVP